MAVSDRANQKNLCYRQDLMIMMMMNLLCIFQELVINYPTAVFIIRIYSLISSLISSISSDFIRIYSLISSLISSISSDFIRIYSLIPSLISSLSSDFIRIYSLIPSLISSLSSDFISRCIVDYKLLLSFTVSLSLKYRETIIVLCYNSKYFNSK